MPRISRVVLPDFAHHVTQRGVRSQPVFFNEADRAFYLTLMREQTDKFGVEIVCYCLMTNHVHLLAVPGDALALSKAIGEAHRRYTLHINARFKVSGFLFQGRFSSCPLDRPHLLAAARYVLLNPVRARLSETAVSWPWSSAAFHCGLRAEDALVKPNTLLGEVPDARAWQQLMESPGEEGIEQVRRLTRTGRPCGGETFVSQAEGIANRSLTHKPKGRPKIEK